MIRRIGASKRAVGGLMLAALVVLSAACGDGGQGSPSAADGAGDDEAEVANVAATVLAVLTRVAPTPEPTATAVPEPTRVVPRIPLPSQAPSISDLLEDIEGGLVQIITPDASGSGFAVSDDGLIITNAHLVEDHALVTVRSVGGGSWAGEVQGRDEALDLAVIKVPSAGGMKGIPLGDASEVRPGDPVFALGFPLSDQLGELGESYTVTSGVVSSLRSAGTVDLIQTDAAINVGNSGGPLINAAGEVIAVNTATFRDYEGISLAISIQEVRDNLLALAAGLNAPERAEVRMREHLNEECQYLLLAPWEWRDAGDAEGCRLSLARYEGEVEIGAIRVWDYPLKDWETLEDFSGWWQDSMAGRARDWHSFTQIYSGRSAVKREGVRQEQYTIQYSWQETEEHCLSYSTDTIALNDDLRRALIFSVSVCEFVPAEIFHAASSGSIVVVGPDPVPSGEPESEEP